MEFWTGATGLFRMRATPANLLDGYADYVAGAKQAEKLGFDAYGAPEHHFMYDGFIPVPLVALAAAAGATTKIKFITGAMLLPLYDPIEAAELVATLDVISGGRAMLGLGMAYRPYEFDGVGTAKRTRGARLSEGIDLLNALTAGGDVDFAGTHYQVKGHRLSPQPIQRPIPTWFCGGTSVVAARRAGRHGHPYWLANAPLATIRVMAEEYFRAGEEAGHDRASLRIASFKDVCMGESVEEAHFLRDALMENFYDEHILGYGYLVDEAGNHLYNPPKDHELYKRFTESIFCGTPEMVVEELSGYAELGVEAVFIETHQREMLAESVIPHFR